MNNLSFDSPVYQTALKAQLVINRFPQEQNLLLTLQNRRKNPVKVEDPEDAEQLLHTLRLITLQAREQLLTGMMQIEDLLMCEELADDEDPKLTALIDELTQYTESLPDSAIAVLTEKPEDLLQSTLRIAELAKRHIEKFQVTLGFQQPQTAQE